MLIDHSALFAALSDPPRRQVFERISAEPVPVGRIAAGLPVSRPAVSQHLKVLLQAGLVSVQQRGTRRLYQVDMRGVAAMRKYLDSFWDHALQSFKTEAESNR